MIYARAMWGYPPPFFPRHLTNRSDTLYTMNTQTKACRSPIVPSLRYRNALAAIDWLIRAFGFEKQAVYLGPDNTTVMHAQLTFGNGMVMLGSVPKDAANGGEFGK